MANETNANFELFKLKTSPKPTVSNSPLFVDNSKKIINVFGGGSTNPYGFGNSILCPSSYQQTNWLNKNAGLYQMPSIWNATATTSTCSSSCSNSDSGLSTKDMIVGSLLSNPQALQVAGNLVGGLFNTIAGWFGAGDDKNAQAGIQVGDQALAAGTKGIFRTEDGKFVQGSLNEDGTVTAADGKNYKVNSYAGEAVGSASSPAPATSSSNDGAPAADTTNNTTTQTTNKSDTDNKTTTEKTEASTSTKEDKNQINANDEAIASADDALAAYQAANDEKGNTLKDGEYSDNTEARTKALGDLTKARETLNNEKINNQNAMNSIDSKINDLQIQDKEKAVTEAEQKSNLSQDQKYGELKDATKTAKTNYDNGQKTVTKAKEQQKTNEQNYDRAKGETAAAAQAEAQKESAMNEAKVAVSNAETDLRNAEALPDTDPNKSARVSAARTALTKAKAQAQKAETEYEQAKKQHEAAKNRESKALEAKTNSDNALKDAENNLTNLKNAWENAKQKEEEYVTTFKKDSAEAIKKAKEALDTALSQKAELEGQKEALEESQKNIDTKLKEVDTALSNNSQT